MIHFAKFFIVTLLVLSNSAFAFQENNKEISTPIPQKLIESYQQWALLKNSEAQQINFQSLSHSNSNRIFIFVSFSMPEQSLKQWLAQAKLAKATVVVRGLVHNSFRDTLDKMKSLITENHSGLQINPALFKLYHIQQV